MPVRPTRMPTPRPNRTIKGSMAPHSRLAGQLDALGRAQLRVEVLLHHAERRLREVGLDVGERVRRDLDLVAAQVGVERRVEDALLRDLPAQHDTLDPVYVQE